MTTATSISNGVQARALIRRGGWRGPTAGLAPGYVQANLVIVPTEAAEDFREFCRKNPRPCPLLEALGPGDWQPSAEWATGADLRTDLPRYRIYERGELRGEVTEIREAFGPGLSAFLLGCSFSFDEALRRGGIPVRHVESGVNVPMYVTNVSCERAGIFAGPMVVSMRPIRAEQVERAVEITGWVPLAHGGPVQIGDPGAIGIRDLGVPEYGEAVEVREGEVPVFWACGVTPQAVACAAKLPRMITHAPGCMFVTDRRAEELERGDE